MIYRVKKRTLFFLGILAAGLAGVVSNYVRALYSREDSLIAPTAHADLPPNCTENWTQEQCENYFNGEGADGGCCAGPSDAGGGGGDGCK